MNLITMVPATARFIAQMRGMRRHIVENNVTEFANRWKHAAQPDDNIWDNELK